jgi:hypothetical protein
MELKSAMAHVIQKKKKKKTTKKKLKKKKKKKKKRKRKSQPCDRIHILSVLDPSF